MVCVMNDFVAGNRRSSGPARRGARWALVLLVAWLCAACSVSWQGSWESEWSVTAPTPWPTPATPLPAHGLLKTFPPTPQPPTTLELLDLSTVEQLARVAAPTRDLRDLALRYIPDLDDIPLVVNSHTPDYPVGAQLEFWVHELGANRNFTITAELIHKTDVAYAWVESGQPVDTARIRAAIDRFSQITYPAVTAFFGSEWKPGVDNDPRLHILHANGIGSGIAGYYSSSDQFSRLARPYSNEKEIFYINLGWLNSTRNYTYYETVLAHEFQHMIHWYKDRNEETWVNEGLSEYAQEVAGFAPNTGFTSAFLDAPATQLNTWGASSLGNSAHYGASYLFIAYFAQRFGPEMVRALVAHPANGIQGFDAILAASGAGVSFDDLFADWVIANYLDDPLALGRDGVFGYRHFSLRKPQLHAEYLHAPVSAAATAATVNNFGTHYILLGNNGPARLSFQGTAETRLADLPPHPAGYVGRVWWSNRGDHLNSRLTRTLDLSAIAPGAPLDMTITMWWEIEEGYDLAYVAVSRDGHKWTPLPGTSARIPTSADSAFGPAYTGNSRGWQVERFDLSEYAGEVIALRLEYVTDDAINAAGWFVADVAVPAISYHSDWSDPAEVAAWQSEGWLLTDNRLPQRWALQLLTLQDGKAVELTRIPVDTLGRAVLDLPDLGNGRRALLAVSGLTPVTTLPAAYTFTLEPAP